ncbi:UNVERIFIED_CONTAM: hypothetical protein FKN15_065661 [Acipenser sinensis]
MRHNELTEGISVLDSSGNVVGSSRVAAKHALMETAVTRVVLPMPILVLPPIIMSFLEKLPLLQSRRRLVLPVHSLVCLATFGLALPLAISLFPQMSEAASAPVPEEAGPPSAQPRVPRHLRTRSASRHQPLPSDVRVTLSKIADLTDSQRVDSGGLLDSSAHRYHPRADSGAAKTSTHCPPKRVPSADRFFTHYRLNAATQNYSVGGQHSSGQASPQAPNQITGVAGARIANQWSLLFEQIEVSELEPEIAALTNDKTVIYNKGL